ncbi:hypothetical protein WKR88_02950 [Trinickia caryophylli]|uniref:Uncharacterized protein n=1 Tax=Trinickia caryophylli TaxID=28094 RepID=A0A1X7FTD6_TRICW|nr:hypothetical protein [Trinickia caryophylli]PMS11919.1 hypothetical protein C0Z17_12005 [Trinickia caryophylli]TRX14003.1 hypothetical protein FNF07_21900 [Trinickia caryophylli]WQE15602.1 hypothetical protein U0034_24110 [Trinickia caryophylli]SMF58452.1 hypothetical protein SAMN06295900_11194 [Trinickia caryophylli]GLU33640.1 hypothetical protein Busp01_34820 [Trinickia caryophylli]
MNNETESLVTRLLSFADLTHDMVSRFGAELMIQTQFIEAVLPNLNSIQRRQVATTFRQGIEHVMAYTDDVPMPAEYHAALLKRANALLEALDAPSPVRH